MTLYLKEEEGRLVKLEQDRIEADKKKKKPKKGDVEEEVDMSKIIPRLEG